MCGHCATCLVALAIARQTAADHPLAAILSGFQARGLLPVPFEETRIALPLDNQLGQCPNHSVRTIG